MDEQGVMLLLLDNFDARSFGLAHMETGMEMICEDREVEFDACQGT